jgi:hypothetical protein
MRVIHLALCNPLLIMGASIEIYSHLEHGRESTTQHDNNNKFHMNAGSLILLSLQWWVANQHVLQRSSSPSHVVRGWKVTFEKRLDQSSTRLLTTSWRLDGICSVPASRDACNTALGCNWYSCLPVTCANVSMCYKQLETRKIRCCHCCCWCCLK